MSEETRDVANKQGGAIATLDFVSKFNSNFKIIKEIKTANKYIHPTYANGIILIEKVN